MKDWCNMSDYIDIKLKPEDEQYIIENWSSMNLNDIVKHISGDLNADGRTKLGHVIKEFLASKGLKSKTTKYEKMGDLELTTEQKEFIKNNCDKIKPLEAARVLFKDDNLTPLSREFKAVANNYKQIGTNGPNGILYQHKEDEYATDDYKAPTSINRLISRVNLYIQNQKDQDKPLYSISDIDNLPVQDEKNLKALLRYMQVPRFGYQANQYDRQVDREIFESTFIRYTYDKSDLLQEEIDRYVSLCSEIVTTSQIDRNIQKIERYINDVIDGTDEQKRVSMSMIENVNSLRERLNKSQDMQKKLYSELTGSRVGRMKTKLNANASVLNLVEAWQNEKTRNEMIEIAKLQKLAEEEDINKLTDMDGVVANIMGISKEEVLTSQ